MNDFIEKINKIHVRILLMLLIPLLVFDIAKSLNVNDLPKYASIITLLLTPMYNTIAKPKLDEIKEKRNKQKNDRKNKRDN